MKKIDESSPGAGRKGVDIVGEASFASAESARVGPAGVIGRESLRCCCTGDRGGASDFLFSTQRGQTNDVELLAASAYVR